MESDFTFKSLISLRNEDPIFTLLKKDSKCLELYIAFLHKTYDFYDRKEIRDEDFMGYLRKFLKDERLAMEANGIEGLAPDNAYRQMLAYKLIAGKVDLSKEGNPSYIVVTGVYKDVVRLIEECTGNVVIGGMRHIEDSINLMLNSVGLISGDKERRLKYLKDEKKKLEAEISEIEKTGHVRALTKDEIRASVHNVDRNIGSFGLILSRGTSRCKDERGMLWDNIKQRIQSDERVTNGEAAVKQFDALLQLDASSNSRALQDAYLLLSNARYKEKMNYIVDTMYRNKDAVDIMREDRIDLRARYKQILGYLMDCTEEINLGFLAVDAFFRSREIHQNRLLYEKSDALLLACKEYGMENSFRYKKFTYKVRKLSVMSPCKRVATPLKQKVKVVNKEHTVSVPESATPVFRDINMVGIPEKFRKLLDRHDGVFSLKDYVKEEGTYFGMYEFIVVKNIMSRYMAKDVTYGCLHCLPEYFKIVDFAPDVGFYKEHEVLSTNFQFNEEGYRLWKKNKFKI